MKLSTITTFFAVTAVLALVMVPLFQGLFAEPSLSPKLKRISLKHLQEAEVADPANRDEHDYEFRRLSELPTTGEIADASGQSSAAIKEPELDTLTITPLPPIQQMDDSSFVQLASYASPVEDSLPIAETVELASHIPEPVGPEILAAWQSEAPQAEHSTWNPHAEQMSVVEFDQSDANLNLRDEHANHGEIGGFDTLKLDEGYDPGHLEDQPYSYAPIQEPDQPFSYAPISEPFEDTSAYETALFFDQIQNSKATAAEHQIRWSLNDAIMASLIYSNRVSSLRIESIEELQNVGVESGEFDVVGFVDQSFRNSSEPVGLSIDTASGVQPIVQEEDLNIAYGLRKQLRNGGEVELNQSYQVRDNDSGILVPDDQAFSRFNARVTKELLRGAGRSIALNEVLVAYHDASAQQAESVSEIANHLNDVMTAYWDIVAARGALFASMENRQLAMEVLNELEARSEIDAERNLLDQSRATIGQRELAVNDAHNDLVQAQIRLVSLVNAPELMANRNAIEILPQFDPDLQVHRLDVQSRINTAIQRRPEITEAIEQIKSAQVTDHVSLNELLPRLSTSIEAGINGLAGDRQVGAAIENQFDNDVTYQVGFNFEVPFANRQARHTKRRTELAVQRLRADWQNTIEQVKVDVLNNAQQFTATQTRLEKQRDILKFSSSELRFLGIRKNIAPKENSNPSFALTQVLAAQDRQGNAKSQLIAAIADKHRALFELNRATGILINSDVIPQEGGPPKRGLFSVYHQYIEDRQPFGVEATALERLTMAQTRQARRQKHSGVQQLIEPVWNQGPASETIALENQSVVDAPAVVDAAAENLSPWNTYTQPATEFHVPVQGLGH